MVLGIDDPEHYDLVGGKLAKRVKVVETVGGGGTEFTDGDSIDTDSNGTLFVGATDIPGTARAVIVDDDGHLQIDVLTSALPSGASTSALQGTGNTTLLSIDSGVDALTTLLADFPNVVGKDSDLGPSRVLSIGGTDSGGRIWEVRTDEDGHLQIDALTLPDITQTTHDNLNANANVQIGDVDIGATNAMPTNSINTIDSNNSTSTPLGGGGNFTGTGTDVSNFQIVTIMLHSDVDSAADGMRMEFSSDNTNWDDSFPFNLDASESQTRRFQCPVTAQYFRVNYTNGGAGQSEFRVQTILHRGNVLTSIHRVDDAIVGDRSVVLVKSVIAGETTAGGGGFVNVKVNPSGSLTAEVNQDDADSLLCNANIQVGDVDASVANPVPSQISDGTDAAEVMDGSADDIDASVNGVVTQSNLYYFDGTTWDRVRGTKLGGMEINGNVGSGSVDATSKPVKVGSKATDWDPDTEGEQGPAAVDEDDRVNLAMDLKGRIVERVMSKFDLLTDIDGVYTNLSPTRTSSAVDCFGYRFCTFGFELDKANTPTDITFQVQVDLGGGLWMDLTNDALGSWIYDDVAVGTGIEEAYTFPICADRLRVKVTITGGSASNSFTVDDAIVFLRN